MKKVDISEAQSVAIDVVSSLYEQEAALENNGLTYIDALMTEIVHLHHLSGDALASKMCGVIPKMTFGTAKRLVKIKYGPMGAAAR